MRVDALTLRAVASELQSWLEGARLDPIIAPTPHAIAMCAYSDGQKRWLLLSAHPQLASVHLIPNKPQKLVAEPSTFVMLLRKYLEGGRVEFVKWEPWERIITLGVRLHDEHYELIAEVMGNLANIILVNEDRMILGALHPVSSAVNHYRAILPGQPYIPPPKQTRTLGDEPLPKIIPEVVTAADLMTAAAAETKPGPSWKTLVGTLAGCSPDLAQAILCRVANDAQAILAPDDARWDAVAQATHALIEPAATAPTFILDAEGHVVDASLLEPCGIEQALTRPAASVNKLLATYFAAREFGDAVGAASGDLRRALKTARDRIQKKLRALQSELDALNEADRLREEGELLLAFATDIPEGAKNFAVPDLGTDSKITSITLDPRLTGIENANARFTRYHKMRRAALQIPEQIARAEVDLARVAQLQTDVDLAETLADITHVRAEIAEARLGRVDREEAPRKKQKAPQKGKGKPTVKPHAGGEPMKFTSADGFTVYVGKNSGQNEYVTFTLATGSDLWFHARGVPGAHVIIKSGGRPVPRGSIEEAAGIAAWYSQSRGSASVPIDYTEQRYVRHMKDGGPGMVIYGKEQTIPATPREGKRS